jgi:excisionase family DNA binding protein
LQRKIGRNRRSWRKLKFHFQFYDYVRVLYEDERIIIYEKDTSAPVSPGPLTLEEAATYLNCTPRKVRALYKSKALSGTRLDYRHWAFTKMELDDYLATHRQKAKRIR